MNCRACNKILPKEGNKIPSYFGDTSYNVETCSCGCSQVSSTCKIDESI